MRFHWLWLLIGGLTVSTLMAADDKPAQKTAQPAAAAASSGGEKTTTTEDGLVITVVAQAKETGAKSGDVVWVHYTGKLTNGEVFDTSSGKAPIRFVLGKGEVIQGWDKGVAGMKIGEKRKLTIPPKLGYGEAGAGEKIPPNSTLIFDVELVGMARPG